MYFVYFARNVKICIQNTVLLLVTRRFIVLSTMIHKHNAFPLDLTCLRFSLMLFLYWLIAFQQSFLIGLILFNITSLLAYYHPTTHLYWVVVMVMVKPQNPVVARLISELWLEHFS